jgi:RNA polymerase sigma-70 factor, ECF subfamily
MDRAGVTTLLGRVREGDQDATNQLLTILYPELRRLAARYLQRERRGHTLQPTALVNEAYLRVFGSDSVDWNDRVHFFAVVARQMRRVLVDHARAVRADKRGGDAIKVSMDDAHDLSAHKDADLIDLDDGLEALAREDPRSAQVVELRFFGGLTEHEIGEALQIAVATVKRDWTFAKAWLFSYLEGDGGSGRGSP